MYSTLPPGYQSLMSTLTPYHNIMTPYQHHILHASPPAPLPPALQHLRNLILQKYMETVLQNQDSPIDLSVMKTEDRDCVGSTGSQSPRSDVSSPEVKQRASICHEQSTPTNDLSKPCNYEFEKI